MFKRLVTILCLLTAGGLMIAASDEESSGPAEGPNKEAASVSDKKVHEQKVTELKREIEISDLEIRLEEKKQELQDLVNPPAEPEDE